MEKSYDHIDELVRLEQKALTKLNKLKLEMGDPDVIRYNQLRASFIRQFMPKTEEDFIQFVKDIKEDYECMLEKGIEEVREELEPQLKEAKIDLEQLQTYLTEKDI